MHKIVIYATQYGNTEIIAQAIAKGIKAQAVNISSFNHEKIKEIDLMVLGSPTQGGRPMLEMHRLIDDLNENSLKHTRFAVFDTLFAEQDLNFALKMLVKTIGYAAPKMAETLKTKRGTLILPPEGFIVKGKKGPLAEGELIRAENWLKM